jgi:D-3-phosphoglycerate dehydrogenase
MTRPVRVLIADRLHPAAASLLADSTGFEVVDRAGLTAEELSDSIAEFDALLVRSRTRVTAELMAVAPRLQLVGRAGIGIDNIDLEAATRRGVIVMNAPRGNAVTTAELAIAHLFALARNLVPAGQSMREGRWEKKRFIGRQVAGSTLGVVGLGNIGRIVAQRALALGMTVLAHDPFVSSARIEELGLQPCEELEALLANADFVTLHVPLTDKTRYLIGPAELAAMKPTAFLINCARGGIVDEQALTDAMAHDVIAGVALDVFEQEPPGELPLLAHPRVQGTPHLGASSHEAQELVAKELVQQVIDYFVDRVARNALNLPRVHPGVQEALWPTLRLAHRVGTFAGQIHQGPVSEIVVKYHGPELGQGGLQMLTAGVLKGVLEGAGKEPVNLVNAPIVARERGVAVSTVVEPTGDFARLVGIHIVGARAQHQVEGTFFGTDDVRLVRIDGYRLEVVPEGFMLVSQNDDVPGVIGRVGTLLGEAGVNISRMQVSLPREGERRALAIWSVDQQIPQSVLESIRGLESMHSVQAISV